MKLAKKRCRIICPVCGKVAEKTSPNGKYVCSKCKWENPDKNGLVKYGTPEEDVSENARGR